MMTTLWVDADACPGAVTEMILRAAFRHQFRTVFVANKALHLPQTDFIEFVLVAKGADIADAYINENAQSGDFVITQDIPLAAQLVPQQIIVMSPYGTAFTADNIAERLSVRNWLTDLRSEGITTGGPKPFEAKQKREFANTFDRLLQSWLKQRG
jgi:uncharacterized protein YaiI (UPF0178 family)